MAASLKNRKLLMVVGIFVVLILFYLFLLKDGIHDANVAGKAYSLMFY